MPADYKNKIKDAIAKIIRPKIENEKSYIIVSI